MAKEYIDYGYTGSIQVTSEVKNVKDTFLPLGGINLTLRQTILLVVGGGLAFAAFKIWGGIKSGFYFVFISFDFCSSLHRNGLYQYSRITNR